MVYSFLRLCMVGKAGASVTVKGLYFYDLSSWESAECILGLKLREGRASHA